jgi:H+/Cl- antiporter ClcA
MEIYNARRKYFIEERRKRSLASYFSGQIQNECIQSLQTRGVQAHETSLPLFILSTRAMASGMSLGLELILFFTGGMLGSMLGVMCRQSMLQARVMDITAASGAIAGFFGFPMAGAMFVLEVPHRMDL